MEIKEIKIGTDYFYQVCDYIEEYITKENLFINGGTLNYNSLTYDSDILLVVFDNKIPIGYNSIVRYDDGLYIYQIAVKKKYQNKGIGTLMLKKAIEIADEENTFVTEHVMNYNIASQKMFLNLGFKKVSEDSKTGNGFYILNQKEINRKRQVK